MVKEVITYNLRYWYTIFIAFCLKMVWKECIIRQVDERESNKLFWNGNW